MTIKDDIKSVDEELFDYLKPLLSTEQMLDIMPMWEKMYGFPWVEANERVLDVLSDLITVLQDGNVAFKDLYDKLNQEGD